MISPRRVWLFAYEDGGGAYLPRASREADITFELSSAIRARKQSILRAIYGFSPDSWEVLASPTVEAFWELATPADLAKLPMEMWSSR
jgi:hypothetical protein